jgi:hypothetical protein
MASSGVGALRTPPLGADSQGGEVVGEEFDGLRRRTGPLNDDLMRQWYGHTWEHAGYDHPNLANCKNRWTFWNVAIAFGEGFGKVESLADLSCGDAKIPRALAEFSGIEPILGDYAEGYEYQGTLQETLPQIDVVDLYVNTNTLEHLDDPDADMRLMREHCRQMLLGVPLDEHEAAGEHLWEFTKAGIEEMYTEAGFSRVAYCEVDLQPVWEHFKFGLWALQ